MNKLLKISDLPTKKLHELGSNAREKDEYLKALQYLDQAIVGYQRERDYKGVIDTLKDRTLTWKHYFLLTKDIVYLVLAQKDAESMLEIAMKKNINEKLSTSYFRLGEVAMLYDNYEEAITNYKKSLKLYVGILAEKGDFRYHLGEALCRSGDRKRGKKTMLQGLNEINRGAHEVSDFVLHVWQSGCHLRLAELLKKDNSIEAKAHLEEAKKIINSDNRLVIRKRQLVEFEKAFKNID